MRFFPFGIVKVSGNSMLPTLEPDQYVIVSALPYLFSKPHLDDLIVFRNDRLEMIKRVMQKQRNKYYVTGDNTTKSTDSRYFGWIVQDQILAKVLFVAH